MNEFPEIAIFIENEIIKKMSPAETIAFSAYCCVGYDSWIDKDIKARAYDELHKGLKEFISEIKETKEWDH